MWLEKGARERVGGPGRGGGNRGSPVGNRSSRAS